MYQHAFWISKLCSKHGHSANKLHCTGVTAGSCKPHRTRNTWDRPRNCSRSCGLPADLTFQRPRTFNINARSCRELIIYRWLCKCMLTFYSVMSLSHLMVDNSALWISRPLRLTYFSHALLALSVVDISKTYAFKSCSFSDPLTPSSKSVQGNVDFTVMHKRCYSLSPVMDYYQIQWETN